MVQLDDGLEAATHGTIDVLQSSSDDTLDLAFVNTAEKPKSVIILYKAS